MSTTGNDGLDALADAIAARVIDKIQGAQKKLFTYNEAAVYLGIGRRVLEGLAYSGKIARVREGSLVRFDREDLDKWILARKGKV